MSTTKQSPSVSPVPKAEGAPGLAPLQTDTATNNVHSNPPSAVPSSAVTESGTDSAVGPMRRKPSRRANTAERRATHNAVERQRRETLNGRFLDLAAMLPNLQSVRRPSKSAIVNSSIALIHQQRRARGVAARELRILKGEADMLRREVNEWRERARMPPADEPIRSQDFHILMTVEEVEENDEERAAYAAMNAVDEADEDEYGEGQDELSDRPTSGGRGANPPMQGYGNMNHGMNMPMGMMPMGMGGMGGMGMQMPPQRGYAPQHQQTHPSHQYGASQQQMGLDFSSVPTMFDSGQDKTAAWTQQQQQQTQQQQQQQMINMMQNQNQQIPAQQWQQAQLAQSNPSLSMFTPPGSSHGSSAPTATTPPASNPLVQQAQQAFLANYQRNAQLFPGSNTSIPTLSGMGFQASSTQAITPPSSIHDGDAGVSVSAPMVTDGMNSVHSSPSGSMRSGSASIHSARASPEGNFSLSPPVPVTSANMNAGMSSTAVPFVPSHNRRTSSGGLAVPQPAHAIGSTVGMPWLASNLNMGMNVGGSYAASGLSLFA